MRIAISGKMFAGKTTAANALVRDLGFTKMALADELKAISSEIAQWFGQLATSYETHKLFAEFLLDKTHPIGRAWLQWLGTNCLRKRLPDIWVEMLLRKIPPSGSIVVDDVRFFNEAEGLQKVGFWLVRIETPDAVRLSRAPASYDPKSALHVSETQLDDYKSWDQVFDGSLPLEKFQEEVVRWASTR